MVYTDTVYTEIGKDNERTFTYVLYVKWVCKTKVHIVIGVYYKSDGFYNL